MLFLVRPFDSHCNIIMLWKIIAHLDFITWALYSNLDSNSNFTVSPHLTSLIGEMMYNETSFAIR